MNDKWKWCLHCNKCYLEGESKVDDDPIVHAFCESTYRSMKRKGLQKGPYEPPKTCPYPDCDGSLWGDSWEWDKVREKHPSWPEVPERGVEYDIYEE